MVKTYYPIKQVLNKPYLIGRMVSWAIELFEYDIQYISIVSIRSKVLDDFFVELSLPPG